MRCESLVTYARYNIQSQYRTNAIYSLCITLFTGFVMSIGSIMISSETERIVTEPITKMVNIIKLLADDPLKKPEMPVFSPEELNNTN